MLPPLIDPMPPLCHPKKKILALPLSEVVVYFSQCITLFLNNTPPDFKPLDGPSVQPVCQCLWDDKGQQIYLYATLYNMTWKIPIYSAYVYNCSKSIGICDVWYIEPQVNIVHIHIMRVRLKMKCVILKYYNWCILVFNVLKSV